MRRRTSKRALITLLLTSTLGAPALASGAEPAGGPTEQSALDRLLESVRSEANQESERIREREARFRAAVDERERLLREARAERRAAEARADELRERYATGEERLADLETQLDETAGDLKSLFTVVNQTAGDALALVDDSLVSAQLPERRQAIEPLTGSNRVASIDDIRTLWVALLEEMTRSGEITRFDAPVISAKGDEEVRAVTRIGAFTALADGDYLRYLPESQRLLALARQPAVVTRQEIFAFEQSAEPLLPIAIDPSKGTILSLIVQTPGLWDRIQQGGVIGYVIIALGLVGLALGLERLLAIGLESLRIRRGRSPRSLLVQLDRLAEDPALRADHEALAVKLDEAVSSAGYKLRRGFGVLVIFAAVSPLLGLLGTVTGMIETFQVITLFGAGDPRLMSGGISQALVTTQLGLSVAIPLLLIHSFVDGRANDIVTRLDERSADLFARFRPAETGADPAGESGNHA
jgi:biopolymer transport protein ExbB